MIAKMTKYSFVLLHSETDSFISELQKIGIIDISRSTKPVDETSSELLDKINGLNKAIEAIRNDKFTRDGEYVSLHAAFLEAQKEYKKRLPWGSFSVERIQGLANLGYGIHFYETSAKKFGKENWAEEYPLEVIDNDGKTVRFVVVSTSSDFNFPVKEIPAPAGSFEDSRAEMESLKIRLAEKEDALRAEKELIPSMMAEQDMLISQLQHHLAKITATPAAENVLDTFIGFAPTEDDTTVQKSLDAIGVYYIAEAAKAEDHPPIKLKNNWFARNFETLTEMYGVPVYDEFDPTPILAPFFMLFWAFCMADAAYGLILIAVGFLLKKVDILGLKPHYRLVISLGVGATILGFFLGAFMGFDLVDVEWIPECFRNCMIVGKLGNYDITMVAAIGIGVFHLCLAMIIKAVGRTKRFGFSSAISVWGWLILIIGGLITASLALLKVIDSQVTKIVIIVIGIISALGIYIFNDPKRSPLSNFGAGLWDTYGMATGLMGDVLSYIRLYALGLAGGKLAGAFNNLGFMVLGDDPTWQWLCFVLVFIIGHAINFSMACLGAFVHPLRLTFVEYFKNSGYEGKGTPYNPMGIIKL